MIRTLACWLPILCAALAGSRAVAVEMTAEVWKRQVLPEEPILVRVTLTNPTDYTVSVVPPYLAGPSFPLRVVEVRDDDQRRQPEYRHNNRGSWLWVPIGGEWQRSKRRPWVLGPGEAAWTWHNLATFCELHEPGRHHLVLQYEPQPSMLRISGDETSPLPDNLWCAALEVDLGWIEILEPPEAERPLVEKLAARAYACWPKGEIPDRSLAPEVAAEAPTSVYVPYLEFYSMVARTRHSLMRPDRLERLRAEVRAFRERNPGFPLDYQLDVLLARCEYFSAIGEVVFARDHRLTPTAEQLARVPPLAQALREAAAASGDAGLVCEMEAWIGLAERQYHLGEGG